MIDAGWSRSVLVLFAVFICSCKRSDPLSAVPNSAGTAVLEDMLIGTHSRAICVMATTRDVCSWRHSEIYIENVKNLSDVKARWADDNLVTVDVVTGTVRRFVNRSKDGQIAIRLTRNASPSGITISHPEGSENIPWPPP